MKTGANMIFYGLALNQKFWQKFEIFIPAF